MANATSKGQGGQSGQGGQGHGNQGHGGQGHGSQGHGSTLEHAKDAASSLAGQAGQAASSLAGQAGSALSGVAGQAGSALSGVASSVGNQVESLAGSAAKGAQSLANQVRDQGPREGYLGQATQGVASGLEQAGKYLEDKHLSGVADDFGGLIKSHPIPAVLIGLGVGFLLGRALRD